MANSTKFDMSDAGIVTGTQLRAARALLDWSIPRTAESCGVGSITLRRFESGERSPGIVILKAIVGVFEENGVLFIDTDFGTGVILVDRRA